MSLEERYEYPPNIEEIAAVLPEAKRGAVFFSWGPGVVYNPKGVELSPELVAHENVHGKRQGTTEESIRSWWGGYLESPRFRFEEELLAHRAEYQVFCEHVTDRNLRYRFASAVAKRLASKLYGSLVTFSEARRLIRSQYVQDALSL